MNILYGLLFLAIVVVVFGGILALIRKAARGVPTAGNIARAHQRLGDERDRTSAQNAAADDIIARAREHGARIPPARVTDGPYTTDEVEWYYKGLRMCCPTRRGESHTGTCKHSMMRTGSPNFDEWR
jgi:hypothetical protein